MRWLLTAVIIFVQVVSMLCGFYDLYKNTAYIQQTLSTITQPIYNWVLLPAGGLVSHVVSSVLGTTIMGFFGFLLSMLAWVADAVGVLLWLPLVRANA